jgi:hypothetical protein
MNNKNVEKCKKKVCGDSYIKKQKELSERMFREMMNHVSNKKSMSEEERKKAIKNLKKMSKNFDIYLKKETENLKKTCVSTYCNPNCKDTIFENGKELSKSAKKKITEDFKKKSPTSKKKEIDILLRTLNTLRKSIFKNKKSVLKNSFYNKLGKKSVKSMKNKGAISGCSTTPGVLIAK